MNLTNDANKVIYVEKFGKRIIGFRPIQNAEIFTIEAHLENFVKKILDEKFLREEIEKQRHKIDHFYEKYNKNPYAHFGAGIYSLINDLNDSALSHTNNGLALDEYKLDGIHLKIRVLNELFKHKKICITKIERFVNDCLEFHPHDSDLLSYANDIKKNDIKKNKG